jgi:hypothetical protein
MKRREFMEKTGCGVLAVVLSQLGLKAFPMGNDLEERKAMVKKILMAKMGKTEAEATAILTELEEKLSMVKSMCICKTCPSYVKEETEVAFCHALIGKSQVIEDEKGCSCLQCPVHKKMELKNGYYCTRKSEMEQEIAKTM